MRYLLIVVVLAAGFFGWKKYQSSEAPAPAKVADPNKTSGANAENRMNNLSGAAPSE